MKRHPVATLFVAIAILSIASTAAFAGASIQAGVQSQGGATSNWIWVDFDLTPRTRVAAGIYDQRMELGLRLGGNRGVFGMYQSEPGAQMISIGGYRSFPLSSTTSLFGWIGAVSGLSGDTGIWAEAGAEISIGLFGPIDLQVGGETTLLKEENTTYTWIGLGYQFF